MFRWITGLIASPSRARKNFIRFVMGTPQMKEYLIQEVARQNLKNHYEALGLPSEHIGLFSLLLGPSIFFLIKEICDRLGETPPGRSLYEPIVAVTLLISLVIAIGVALILDARQK